MAIYEKELISEKIKNNIHYGKYFTGKDFDIFNEKKTMNWKEYINVMMVRLFMTKFNGYKLSKLNSRKKIK